MVYVHLQFEIQKLKLAAIKKKSVRKSNEIDVFSHDDHSKAFFFFFLEYWIISFPHPFWFCTLLDWSQ